MRLAARLVGTSKLRKLWTAHEEIPARLAVSFPLVLYIIYFKNYQSLIKNISHINFVDMINIYIYLLTHTRESILYIHDKRRTRDGYFTLLFAAFKKGMPIIVLFLYSS